MQFIFSWEIIIARVSDIGLRYPAYHSLEFNEHPRKSIANDFNHYFGPKYVYMVDGQAAMTSPNDEFGKLIEFFGFKSTAIHFELNKSKGFHCLNKPVNFCLGDNKGTSRKEHVDLLRRVFELMISSQPVIG